MNVLNVLTTTTAAAAAAPAAATTTTTTATTTTVTRVRGYQDVCNRASSGFHMNISKFLHKKPWRGEM